MNPHLHDRIDVDFEFHPANSEEKKNAHSSVRMQCKALAHSLADSIQDSRELNLALTKLEECMHWANAALAKQG